ncbi:MAG: hypothetical protein ACNA8W_00290 [Bradymonadaceae bacterium]
MLTLLWGCGESDLMEPTEPETVDEVNYPTPDPGPRYFPAPDKEFFDDPNIRTLVPEDERAPLILNDNVYWLADRHAETVLVRTDERVEFPLAGNEAMLGYEVGHIVLNKWSSLHHFIEKIEVSGDRIIWTTRIPDLDETALSASLNLDIEPGTMYPPGFDPIDVYFFEDRTQQEIVIAEKMEHFRQRRLDQVRTRRLGLSLCSDPAVTEGEAPMMECNDIVEGNRNHYTKETAMRTLVDANGDEYQVPQVRCKGDTTWSRPLTECPCGSSWTTAQCAEHICDDVCDLGEEDEGGDDPSWGGGGSLSFCLNTNTNPADTNRCPGTYGLEVEYGVVLGSPLFNLTLKPIFMATVGVKFRARIFFIGAEVTLGVYAGIGYGANAALNLGTMGGGASWSKRVYWSDITGAPLTTIPVFFGIVIEVDPYAFAEAYVDSSIGGSTAYEYYDEKWFYLCLKFGTRGFNWYMRDQEQARSQCGLPNHNRDAQFNGFIEQGFEAELLAGIALGLGIELRPNIAGTNIISKPSGIWFEPIRLLGNLHARLRAPDCFWRVRMWFGGLLGIGIHLKISRFTLLNISNEWSWVWSFMPQLNFTGTFTGEPWESIFGCGVYNEIPPYEGSIEICGRDSECPGMGYDPGRCFVSQCVDHGPLRFSLGWFNQDVNLGLYIRDPGGTVHAYPSNVFTRAADGTEGNVFIENAVFNNDTGGEYEVWVGLISGGGTTELIPFTLDIERDGVTRQTISGNVYGDRSNVSPTVFTLCDQSDPSCTTGVTATPGPTPTPQPPNPSNVCDGLPDGSSCGAPTETLSGCIGQVCSNEGTQTRTTSTYTCQSGSCVTNSQVTTEPCPRATTNDCPEGFCDGSGQCCVDQTGDGSQIVCAIR